jgi:hypothetical protein
MSSVFNRFVVPKFLFAFAAILLTISAYFEWSFFIIPLKIIVLPLLLYVYIASSKLKSKKYIIAIFFASLSNVLFTFNALHLIYLGLISFLLFRAILLHQIYFNTEQVYLVPFLLGFFLFSIPNAYLFYITSVSLGSIFYFGLANILLNAIIGGISISSYSNNSSLANTSLLISSLLFVVLSVLFIIQKFYIFIQLYESLRVIILLAAHYFYYYYLIFTEKSKAKNHLF